MGGIQESNKIEDIRKEKSFITTGKGSRHKIKPINSGHEDRGILKSKARTDGQTPASNQRRPTFLPNE